MAPGISLPAGYRLKFHETLDSTNAEALRLAENGDPGNIWIWAASQNAGRGRAGRRWDSPEGNLFASLLLYPGCATQKLPELGFVAGVALHDTVSELAATDMAFELELKWPNDLLLNRKKLSGLLLESNLGASPGVAAVIGFGLNLVRHPVDTTLPATSLRNEGIDAKADEALELLAKHFTRSLETWKAGENFAPIRAAWLERSIPVGSAISIHAPNERLDGIFSGIGDDGALLLYRDGESEKRITAADIFPL